MNNFNYTNLTPFKWFVLENFPFIEADFDALTEWQLFCKLGKEINKIITSENTLGTQVESVTNAFIKLQNYVNNYFNNLDVQEEINTKLNEMAQDGTLAQIINEQIFNELNQKIEQTNERINDINESTLNHIVTTLPETLVNNNQYEHIITENELNIDDLPVSYFENLENAIKLTNENTENDLLKVATFNISTSNVPYDTGLNGVKKLTKLQNIFNKIGASILGVNETFESLLYPANEFLTTKFLPNYNIVKTWENILPLMDYGGGILSNLTPQITQTKIYTSYHAPEHQGYIKNTYSYNNKIISFYCTHFCYNDETTLRNQIAELYTDIQADNNPYKIIVGDFNFDLSEYNDYLATFISSGYKVVNGGQYKTYDDTRNIGVDEIMVSSNIDIISSGVGNSDYIENLSDHFPLWSTLKFN